MSDDKSPKEEKKTLSIKEALEASDEIYKDLIRRRDEARQREAEYWRYLWEEDEAKAD